MRTRTQVWLVAAGMVGSTLAPARTAAAQEPEWVRELEAQIEAAVEAVGRLVNTELRDQVEDLREQAGDLGRNGRQARGPEVTEAFTRTLMMARDGTLEVTNTLAGDVTITGRGGSELRIEAVKRVRGGNEANARALLGDLGIEIVERGGVIEVRTDSPRRRGVSAAVDYTIALPRGANVSVRTISGDLRVTNVAGELRAQSVSGNVTATSVSRLRLARSTSGDVSITDAEGEDITGSTLSGSVRVRNLKARSVDLETVSGDLSFANAQCERLSLKTISGNIDYAGRFARNGRYEMRSHSGNLQIAPAGDTGFDVEAATFSGDVRSDFGLTVSGRGNSFAGRGPGRSLRASYGDASAVLSLRSFSGNIVLTKR